jgi:ATP-dependent Clp protease adaptor protein ClpS
MVYNEHNEKTSFKELITEDLGEQSFLVLHNDEEHTFEYVIDSLMDVCKIDSVQAEQITFIVHFKGKCDVKKGPKESLKPYKAKLNKKGLTATID